MKIGFRLSKCIEDIAHERVKVEDVAFVVSLTSIREGRNLEDIIDNWIHSTILDANYREIYIDTLRDLLALNKLIQPRLQGIDRHWIPNSTCHWMDMYPSQPPKNQAVETAWNNYRVIQELS